jgi:hypothetical protein
MRHYQRLTREFLRQHPGEKTRLMGQAVGMLWSPRVTQTYGRPGAGGVRDLGREWAMPAFALALFALALPGLRLLPRSVGVFVVLLLLYQTLAAMLFVGATRYRVPWDFLLALAAAAALLHVHERLRRRT